eukprot:CAMPEP_0172154410 /NCGR_PEP_ID=MMETSP1050-20130122/2020_1 /TAXON_ID=233186 /ORGANISM="Cryptomonas curvata, Strain CCAP979/52" /LENGTH=259 /DNA_ID=CAMNT_0012823125 /DNA_START=134 /DNA_END=910 /DNA_ORIENTATION=+
MLPGTTASPLTECISVFRNTSVLFTNPRAGKLSGLTLRFISDVGFNRSSKIFLKLPGFTRLDGTSGEQFMFTSGTTPGAEGGSVSVGQAGDLSISCFTGAQWDDEAKLLTLTHLSSPAVPPNLPVTIQISPEANLILPGLLADLQSGVALGRSAAAPGECEWSPVSRVQPVAYLLNTSVVLDTALPCAATGLTFTFTSTVEFSAVLLRLPFYSLPQGYIQDGLFAQVCANPYANEAACASAMSNGSLAQIGGGGDGGGG